jgi:hypothetical protein
MLARARISSVRVILANLHSGAFWQVCVDGVGLASFFRVLGGLGWGLRRWVGWREPGTISPPPRQSQPAAAKEGASGSIRLILMEKPGRGFGGNGG